jgi:hypothetical protein
MRKHTMPQNTMEVINQIILWQSYVVCKRHTWERGHLARMRAGRTRSQDLQHNQSCYMR